MAGAASSRKLISPHSAHVRQLRLTGLAPVEAANEGTFDMAIKFRKGDIVLIQGTVKYDTTEDDTFVSVWIGATADTVLPKPSEVELFKQHIEIGDMVSFNLNADASRVGRVLAIDNDHVWVDLGGGDYCTRTVHIVTRCDVDGI